jgi:hypothetical protein
MTTVLLATRPCVQVVIINWRLWDEQRVCLHCGRRWFGTTNKKGR